MTIKPILGMLLILSWASVMAFYVDTKLHPDPVIDSGVWIDASVIRREIFCHGGNWHLAWLGVNGRLYVTHNKQWWHDYKVCDRGRIKVVDNFVLSVINPWKKVTDGDKEEIVHKYK